MQGGKARPARRSRVAWSKASTPSPIGSGEVKRIASSTRSCGNERGRERRPGLDEDAREATRAARSRRAAPRSSASASGNTHDLDARAAERRLARGRRLLPCETQTGPRARAGDERERPAGGAGANRGRSGSGLRSSSPGSRTVSSGSSAQRRADADRDGVALRAQEMDARARLGAGDPHRPAARTGDLAVGRQAPS